MKLIIREYLESLREREELDAILPDLLSEIGFNVLSRPGRGTRQYGVDLAATGKGVDGEEKLFLFTVKQGNLTRHDWDGAPQALRPSINEILDTYIPTQIPKRLENHRIVICLCFGGEVLEQVRVALSQFTKKRSDDRIEFQEWNGDLLAEKLLTGVLRENVLPENLRSSFRKAVALVDDPEACYFHFSALLRLMLNGANDSQKAKVTTIRQIYVCVWIIYVWARAIENLEAPYRISELALLTAWELQKAFIDKRNRSARFAGSTFYALVNLNLMISDQIFIEKILPHIGKTHALSLAVQSREAVDVNLKLFSLLGQVAMSVLWRYWFIDRGMVRNPEDLSRECENFTRSMFKMINENPTLFLPFSDQNVIEVGLVVLVAILNDEGRSNMRPWLLEMAARIIFSTKAGSKYPSIYTDYDDLIRHPRERTKEYFVRATAGSVLVPFISAWLLALGESEMYSDMARFCDEDISHCTLQLWLPEADTDDSIFIGGREHGRALIGLSLEGDEIGFLKSIKDACDRNQDFSNLSPISTDVWPVMLLACKHFRFPIPPQFWINTVLKSVEGIAS